MIPLEKNKNPFTLSQEITVCEKFTETYKKYKKENIYACEAQCMKVQFLAGAVAPKPRDMFAGRFYAPLVYFSPQEGSGIGYIINENRLNANLNDENITDSQRKSLESLSNYWLTEQTQEHVKNAFPADMKRWLPYEDYFTKRAVAHPLYRISGTHLDYKKLLDLGVDGLQDLICEKEKYVDEETAKFYKALHDILYTFSDFCFKYQMQVRELIDNKETDSDWKKELLEIEQSLKNVAHCKADNFRDAIQLTFLWWVFSKSRNFGRMDKYLAKYYVHDVDNGVITEERALELLCGLWQMIDIECFMYDSRALIGGKGRENEEECNRFCKLAIDATRKVRAVVPQLALRFYDGMDESVMEKAYQAIGEGCTFPMLYNDDANIKAVSKAFGVSEEIAVNYCPYGCGEYILEHESLGTPSGIINLTKALEVTINHGKDLETGAILGLDLGGLDTYKNFDELYNAYKKQIEHFVPILAKMEELEYVECAKHFACLGFSMLYDDCISRGKALLNGGVRYLGGTLESYGNVNAADSLTAIKTMLYDQKTTTADELLEALKTNFENNPELRKIALDCPKYGNENEEADKMLTDIHEHICNTTRESVKNTIMHSYLIVVINNDANTVLGHLTSASADGRLSGLHLANANNPQGGADTSGLTAMLNSIVKPPIHYHAGSVQNLKLNKVMFNEDMLPKTKALLDTYFAKGGAQIMITVVSREEIEDAIKNPQNHKDLIVRVGGFSAKFIQLGADVQQEILSRSLHG